MQIYRFDDELGIPVSRFGSDFAIVPLTGLDSRVCVQVVHLPAGGRIGRHPTQVRQLLAVVSGSAWASGADAQRRELPAGRAALWEPAEEHEAGSDGGATAVVIEGVFEPDAFLVTRPIEVVDYDADWPDWFEQIRALLWPAVSDLAVRIDHVGSTAVPGLAAKPIIDVDIVLPADAVVPAVVERLTGLGYRWRGELGVPGRQAFTPRDKERLPRHNLYVVVEDNQAHLDHWLLRDLLREDAGARDDYAVLKRANAVRAGADIDVYVAAKAEFVSGLLARARRERGLSS